MGNLLKSIWRWLWRNREEVLDTVDDLVSPPAQPSKPPPLRRSPPPTAKDRYS